MPNDTDLRPCCYYDATTKQVILEVQANQIGLRTERVIEPLNQKLHNGKKHDSQMAIPCIFIDSAI